MIRRAEEKDIDRIMRLLVEVNMVHHMVRPDLFKGPATKYTRSELEEKLRVEEDPIFVYEDEDGNCAGYVFCMTELCPDTPLRCGMRTLYIDDLCVDEGMRGQHVGQQLYEYVLNYAKEHDYYNVTLHVWGGNEGAMKFYRKMGMSLQYACLEQILDSTEPAAHS